MSDGAGSSQGAKSRLRSRFRRIAVLIGLAALLLWWFLPGGPRVEPGSVLVLDLGGTYVEGAAPPLLSRLFGESRRPFAGLLSELAKAERDARLSAVVLRVRPLQLGWAKAQELRGAIASLRAAGRHTVAYLELASFGANREYYVASAAEKVYAGPAVMAPIVGLAADFVFLGGFWEQLGIEFEVERIGRYKTMADMYAARGLSEANREMSDALLDSLDAQFVGGIAESRGLSVDEVRAAVAAGPVTAEELVAHRLVDEVVYLDELTERLGGPLIRGRDYAQVDPASVGFEPVAQFALVYGSGPVVSGEERVSGEPLLASRSVSKALESAAESDEIDAIIFRIDSPGGDAFASDVIWRAAELAQKKGKPLVASFSDVAASGGYYIAAGADAVVASPASITGSIGVVVLRPVLAGLLEKLGIGFATLARGEHADLGRSLEPLDAATRERLRTVVSSTYDLFVERVAEGRGLTREAVDAAGRGRVWTGAQAHELGLVDELGGLRTAVRVAKRRLDLDPDADVALIPYPQPRSLIEQLGAVAAHVRLALAPELPGGEWARRLEPWLQAARDGAPALLIPFWVDVH